ncbi:hypothetical protein BY996DRAFT_8445806 [Phakopsora pachyrhizi]|nr:hypothetical protein BY996DRAFT_8445806 [Phakopsora pachyrhizi]
MEADKDAIFEGEIEVISKEDFLKNITVANRLLSLVIDNPRPDSDIITADNSGIIPESHSNTINNPEIQAPQSLVETQNPSQGVTLSIPDNLTVGPPTSSSNFLNTVARDIIAPIKFEPQKVTTDNPLSVECSLAGFLASCFSFNKNKSAVLPIEGLKVNEEHIKDPAAETFKNLDDFVDKIVHVLIAINMVQAHSKC